MIVVNLNKQFEPLIDILKNYLRYSLTCLNVEKDILFTFNSDNKVLDISNTDDVRLANAVYNYLLGFDAICKHYDFYPIIFK